LLLLQLLEVMDDDMVYQGEIDELQLGHEVD
jgi:hypothetical protein